MNIGFAFSHQKAVQALNFFAGKNGGEINKLKALKLVFFADRYHLRKYGRPITNDQYWAMPLGPVPSGVKEIFERDSVSRVETQYARRFFVQGTKEHTIKSKAPVDTNVLSESDIEALEFSWHTFGRRTGIVDLTHKYPEWKKHELALKKISRVPMDYSDFLEDPPSNVNPCHPLSQKERLLRREQIDEMCQVSALWR